MAFRSDQNKMQGQGAYLGGGLPAGLVDQKAEASQQSYGEKIPRGEVEAERLLNRLGHINTILDEIRGTVGITADKIVGHDAPNKVVSGNAGASPQPFSFFDRLSDTTTSLESIALAIHEQVLRIQRAF